MGKTMEVKVNKAPRVLSGPENISYQREKLEVNKPTHQEAVNAILGYLSSKDDLTDELKVMVSELL